MKKDHLRVRLCLTVVLLSLFLSGPASIFGSWGLEVGRANGSDAIRKQKDWLQFKQTREAFNRAITFKLEVERQRQLLGMEGEDLDKKQLYEEVEDFWFNFLLVPLWRITLNPAASCAEAQYALSLMMGMRRQQQLIGIEESEVFSRVYDGFEEATSIRCRNEALDECLATGRFMQILQLFVGGDRQSELLGRAGSLEKWAEGALTQCAIYELHFVSKTKADNTSAGFREIVRDGRVPIRYPSPPGGLKEAIKTRTGLAEVLNGRTTGGNNPFFVSVKCTTSQPFELVCSPGTNSAPIEVRINELDLRHREFYIESEKLKYVFTESEVSRERFVGEDKFSFLFSGGKFSIQALLKSPFVTTSRTMEFGDVFYMAHQKDQVGDFGSVAVKAENPKVGVYPVILKFTYADQQVVSGATMSDSTEFELIHKPEPKPFEKPPDPIRKPLKPPNK